MDILIIQPLPQLAEWKLPIPVGSDPRDIDLEAINALRIKVFSNLTNSEIHQL